MGDSVSKNIFGRLVSTVYRNVCENQYTFANVITAILRCYIKKVTIWQALEFDATDSNIAAYQAFQSLEEPQGDRIIIVTPSSIANNWIHASIADLSSLSLQ